MTPKQTVEAWVAAFNRVDVPSLVALYHPDAVNHQVPQTPVDGVDAIRAMFEAEFATAEMHCIVDTIHEAGEVAILEWKDPRGLRGCGSSTSRTVASGSSAATGTSSASCGSTAYPCRPSEARMRVSSARSAS